MFHRNIFKVYLIITVNKEERSCSLLLEMLSHFSPPSPCAVSMAQGVSLSTESDKGRCPLTPPAFFEKTRPTEVPLGYWTEKTLLLVHCFKQSRALNYNSPHHPIKNPKQGSLRTQTALLSFLRYNNCRCFVDALRGHDSSYAAERVDI